MRVKRVPNRGTFDAAFDTLCTQLNRDDSCTPRPTPNLANYWWWVPFLHLVSNPLSRSDPFLYCCPRSDCGRHIFSLH
jgi:hypothetical protein